MVFTMEDGSRTRRGTDVILHISEEEKEFLEEYRVREVLRRYCGFMATPVYFDVVKKEEPAKEGQEGEKAAENKEPKSGTDQRYPRPVAQGSQGLHRRGIQEILPRCVPHL